MTINQEDLVSMLREIASYERGFKQQAFDNASSSIAGLSNLEFEEYINSGKFTKLTGVGKSVEACIKEFIETGNMSRLDNLRNSNFKCPIYET